MDNKQTLEFVSNTINTVPSLPYSLDYRVPLTDSPSGSGLKAWNYTRLAQLYYDLAYNEYRRGYTIRGDSYKRRSELFGELAQEWSRI